MDIHILSRVYWVTDFRRAKIADQSVHSGMPVIARCGALVGAGPKLIWNVEQNS